MHTQYVALVNHVIGAIEYCNSNTFVIEQLCLQLAFFKAQVDLVHQVDTHWVEQAGQVEDLAMVHYVNQL